jgi:hydrogenase expression/formation protein HypD
VKFVTEYRDPDAARQWVERIRKAASRRWTLMDVCGGQTHSLLRYGLESSLADCVELIHGPGCPVCVTPTSAVDTVQRLARLPGMVVMSFGDMLRVPGSRESLLDVRARGGRIQIVYSPMDAVRYARLHPDDRIVFLAVGFETTAPATALAVLQAERLQLTNFSILSSHVRVLPAMEHLMLDPNCRVQGFLAAGHVCTVTGFADYEDFVERFRVPVVVTGFEPVDLLKGIFEVVQRLERSDPMVVNCYGRSARREGNLDAQALIARVFEVGDGPWRGFGSIARGRFQIRREYAAFDAEKCFGEASKFSTDGVELCMSADVMSGRIKPPACPYFGNRCTPDTPLGAPMVSSEGACAAYLQYRATVNP